MPITLSQADYANWLDESTHRMARSRQLLESGDLSVTAAAEAVGFASRGHFAAAFRRKYGVNPGVYVRGRRA